MHVEEHCLQSISRLLIRNIAKNGIFFYFVVLEYSKYIVILHCNR